METWHRKDNPAISVEAIRLNEENVEAVAALCGGDLIDEIDPEHPEEIQKGINLSTPEGYKRASLHMYVIKYGGNWFTIHNRVFELDYTPTNRPSPPPESAGDARRERGFADPWGGFIGGSPM